MMLSSHDRQVLAHILEHCIAVGADVIFFECYGKSELRESLERSLTFSIEQIGELVNEELSSEFRHSHPEVPWKLIISMRHKLVHHYADSKFNIIWSTAVNSVPELREFIEKVLYGQAENSVSKMDLH